MTEDFLKGRYCLIRDDFEIRLPYSVPRSSWDVNTDDVGCNGNCFAGSFDVLGIFPTLADAQKAFCEMPVYNRELNTYPAGKMLSGRCYAVCRELDEDGVLDSCNWFEFKSDYHEERV